MAARTSCDGENAQPVRIQSQYLRENQLYDAAGPISGFAIIPEGEALPAIAGSPRRGPDWLEEKVKRAIAAAQDAGLSAYRVEIDPNGTISLVVGIAGAAPTQDSLDE